MKKKKQLVFGTGIGFAVLSIIAITLMILATTVPAKQAWRPNRATISQMNDRIVTLESGKILPGTIIMWSGELGGEGDRHPVVDDIVYWNWHVCDGVSPTPDLRERFVIGAGGDYPINDKGGSDSYALSAVNIPRHNHELTGADNGTTSGGHHLHNINYSDLRLMSGAFEGNELTPYYAVGLGVDDGWAVVIERSHEHRHDQLEGVTAHWGNTPPEPIETMPPYYSLIFLMYVEP